MEQISWPLILSCIAAILALIAVFKFATATKYPYVETKILTAAELRFFKTLRWVIPKDLYLSVKPRLGDIIDVDHVTKGKDRNWIRHYGAAIWSKHLDFVIFDPKTAEVILCIELDDASHNLPQNKARDEFKNKALDAAGIPLMRYPVKNKYTKDHLIQTLEEYI